MTRAKQQVRGKRGGLWRFFWQCDGAQDIAEYAMLLAVVLVIAVTTITAVGANTHSIFSKATSALTNAIK